MATRTVRDVDRPYVQAATVRVDGRITVRLVGEVDAELREYFDSVVALVAATGEPVEVDLSAVTFCCAELPRFLTLLREVVPGGVVRIGAMSPVVESLLELCGFVPPPWAGLVLPVGR